MDKNAPIQKGDLRIIQTVHRGQRHGGLNHRLKAGPPLVEQPGHSEKNKLCCPT